MKKILVFALICTLILGAAMAETMPCMMGENTACPRANTGCRMAEGCAMTEAEGACPMESCPAEECPMGEGECVCTGAEEGECEQCEICCAGPVYLLPESDLRLIEKEELEGVDKDTLALMRNEILARHGYPFKKAQYQEYFGAQSWYSENPDFDYNMLSKIEMDNVETIKKLEAAK